MGASGANPFSAQDSVTTVTSYTSTNPSWSPNGERVAFTGNFPATATNGLWSVGVRGADSGIVRLEFPVSASYSPIHPSWSPAGDSLLFQAGGRLYAIAAPDAATVPGRVAALSSGSQDWPSWTSAGIVFRWIRGNRYDYYLRQPTGRILRVYRAAGTDDTGGSFR
jgi:Tol biopolymer transport system component